MGSDDLGGTVTDAGSDRLAPGEATDAFVIALGDLGRYRSLRRIGAGGMGIVFEAHDTELDRPVALKLVHASVAQSSAAQERLRREAQAMARLSHPNVVTVYDVDSVHDRVFIAMELVRGTTMRAYVGAQDWRHSLALLISAGRGLAAAHAASVIHRDFKPDNVLIGDDGSVRVGDFGLAERTFDKAILTSGSSPRMAAAGTAAYMAPERLHGDSSALADQFAYCVSAYEVLEGVRPFPTAAESTPHGHTSLEAASSPRRWTRSEIPARIRAVLDRGMRADPEARWPDLETLLQALADALGTRRKTFWIALALAVCGGTVLAVAAARTPAQAAAACEHDADTIREVWNPIVRASYLGTSNSLADATEDVAWFDRFTDRWQSTARDVCAAPSSATASKTVRCLDDARTALALALARTDRATWPVLPDPRLCPRTGNVAVIRDLRNVGANSGWTAAFDPTGDRLAFLGASASASPGSGTPVILDTKSGSPLAGRSPPLRQVIHFTAANQLLAHDPELHLVRIDLDAGTSSSIDQEQFALAISDDATHILRWRLDDIEVENVATRRVSVRWRPPVTELVADQRAEPGSRRFALGSVDANGDPGGSIHLTILDPTRGSTTSSRLRLHPAMNWGVSLAWLDGHTLVVTGEVEGRADAASLSDGAPRQSVWRVDLDDVGRVTNATQLYAAPRILRILDASHGQVALAATSTTASTVRVIGGVSTPMPNVTDERVTGSDAARGWLLLFRHDRARVTDTSGATLLSVEGEIASSALHHGHMIIVRPTATAEGFTVTSVDRAGTEARIATLDGVRAAVVRCSEWAERCVVGTISANGSPLVAELLPDGVGPMRAWPWPIQTASGIADIAADGKIAGIFNRELVVLDPATGKTAELPENLVVQAARFARDSRSVYYSGVDVATGSYELRVRSLDGRDSPRLVLRSPNWIAGFAILDGDEIVYTTVQSAGMLSLLTVQPAP